MSTCDACKWWDEGHGQCNCPKLMQPGKHHNAGYGEQECPDDGLLVQAEDDRGMMYTGPKFGCIHHEPK